MSEMNMEAQQQWVDFLKEWPMERLKAMTLEEYYGTDDSFYSWIVRRTDKVGEYLEGPFSSGIRLRAANGTISTMTGVMSDERYVWYRILGVTRDEAFTTLRQELVVAAEAARSGDLSPIDTLKNCPGALCWKVAFLYQDPTAPCVLPVFPRKYIRAAGAHLHLTKPAALHKELLAERGDRELFTYAAELLATAKARRSGRAKVQETLARFERDPRLTKALRNPEDRERFARFAEAIHEHGLDWWTVRIMQSGSIRCGRNNSPENGTISVAGELDPQQSGLRVRWNKRIAEASEWQPLDEALVELVDDEEFAAEFRAAEQLDRPGRWPGDYRVDQPEAESGGAAAPSIVRSATPLNQILYGPPGTGKTYATIEAALNILVPEKLQALQGPENREALRACFEEFCAAEQIVFCTFHQSFSYEDFVQGIRARTDGGNVDYSVEDGIFKRLCDRASLGTTAKNDVFDQAVDRFREVLEEAEDAGTMLKTKKGKSFRVKQSGPKRVLAYPVSSSDQKYDYTVYFNDVRRLYEGTTPGEITNNSSYVWGVLDYLRTHCELVDYVPPSVGDVSTEKFVLIIDEINRGNVSRIFGELITLIEPSKRAGKEEALSVALPYSEAGERFSVPANVYLIGTMNTADRSLAGLDIALRRRFVFREMPARPELLSDVEVGGVNIGGLLRVMNQRIEVLLDRDHCLGHAYFMPLRSEDSIERLAAIFRNQIFPLLQEYFFEDWERIRWVLNDQRAHIVGTQPFVQRPQSELNLQKLFGDDVAGKLNDQRWELNEIAFGSIDSYRNILG